MGNSPALGTPNLNLDQPLPTGGQTPPQMKNTTQDPHRAGWASSLGSALEYYDFALYSLASALIFGPLFFPAQDPSVALLASFGTYFIGFAIRPVGGIVFGILGDRLGRKFVLLATVLLMGAASTLIGVLPTYASVGYWAPAMLIFLRLLQGLGAGAEQAGAAVLMTEYAPRERRGFFASLPFMGIQLGTIAAALVYFILLLRIDNVAETWLWRLPFLLSVVIIAVAIWIRLRLKESPEFAKLEARHQVDDRPLAHLLESSRKTLLLGIAWVKTADRRSIRPWQSVTSSALWAQRSDRGPLPRVCRDPWCPGRAAGGDPDRPLRAGDRVPLVRDLSVADCFSGLVGVEPWRYHFHHHRDLDCAGSRRLGHVRGPRGPVARDVRGAASLHRGVRRAGGVGCLGRRHRAADRRRDHLLDDQRIRRRQGGRDRGLGPTRSVSLLPDADHGDYDLLHTRDQRSRPRRSARCGMRLMADRGRRSGTTPSSPVKGSRRSEASDRWLC